MNGDLTGWGKSQALGPGGFVLREEFRLRGEPVCFTLSMGGAVVDVGVVGPKGDVLV